MPKIPLDPDVSVVLEQKKGKLREAVERFLEAPSAYRYVAVKDAMKKYEYFLDDHLLR